jgi:hypothetical protein
MQVGKVRLAAARRLVEESLGLSRTQLSRDDGRRDRRRAADADAHDFGERHDRGGVVLEGARGPAMPHVRVHGRARVREDLQLSPDHFREARIA